MEIDFLWPRNLHEGLRDYARIAAFADSRFPPVQLTELRDLACTVRIIVFINDLATHDFLKGFPTHRL